MREGKRRIVIVDDEPVNLELAESALSGNYQLTKLIAGEQLFKLMERVKPDMILLDVQMPGMSGYQVMERLQSDPEHRRIPVIFLTSQESVEDEKRGFRLGAKDFIRKPFEHEVMLARIRAQMELYAYRNELEAIIERKTRDITALQHVFTVSWAETIESRDGTTGFHVRNTTIYFEILLKALAAREAYAGELPEEILDDLLRASALHDIGKVGISDMIPKKPGPLDREEFEEMKKHSLLGGQMIEKIISKTQDDRFLRYAEEMACSHHERWDGTGYPRQLKGKGIPVYVRAMSVADVYDALTSVRPYKRAYTHEEALEIMQGDCGKFFDPDIFTVFLEQEETIRQLKKSGLPE